MTFGKYSRVENHILVLCTMERLMWEIPVILFVLTHDVIAKVLLKKITEKGSRVRRLSTQFFFCLVLSVSVLLVSGETSSPSIEMLFIFFVGGVNSFAAYCQWRAIDISLSKTAFFTQAEDLIAMGLAYSVLGETQYLNTGLAAGVLLCTLPAVLLSVLPKKKGRQPSKDWRRLIGWVAGYSIIWGIALFATRSVATEGLSLPNFLVAWYTGAFVGSLVILLLSGKKERGEPLEQRDLGELLVLSLVVVASMLAYYWSVQLAPLTVVQPIYQVSEMIFPTLIGLYVFKEKEWLTRLETGMFVVGIGGCSILIALF